jgi:hypothetical protein
MVKFIMHSKENVKNWERASECEEEGWEISFSKWLPCHE